MEARADGIERPQDERAWWLRALLVLQSPRPVFAALRDDSDEAAHAREEPLLAIVLLAGIAGVLATNVTGRLLDEPEYDALLIAVWALLAGTIHGAFGYFLLGALVHLGSRLAGGQGSYRRARHLLGFAAVPLALSLAVWPVRLAVHGEDTFRFGGTDTGAADTAFEALELAFIGWAAALLLVGIRTVHGWGWPRSFAALALAAAPVAAVVVLAALG